MFLSRQNEAMFSRKNSYDSHYQLIPALPIVKRYIGKLAAQSIAFLWNEFAGSLNENENNNY